MLHALVSSVRAILPYGYSPRAGIRIGDANNPGPVENPFTGQRRRALDALSELGLLQDDSYEERLHEILEEVGAEAEGLRIRNIAASLVAAADEGARMVLECACADTPAR